MKKINENKPSKSYEFALKLLERFNEGEYENFSNYFSDNIMLFFTLMKNNGLLNQIDIDQIPTDEFTDKTFEFLADNGMLNDKSYDSIPEEFKNRFLLYGLENDYENTINYIIQDLLTDVKLREDGNFYLYLGNNTEELASFYCDGYRRDVSPADVAKQIFSDEGLQYGYFDSDIEYVRDIIEGLNEENTNHLKNKIFEIMGNKELSLDDYDNEFFQSLTTTNTFKLTMDDIGRLITNEAVMDELYYKDLSELISELKNLYWNAENGAYESEIYDNVYWALEEYFKGKILWEKRSETSEKYDNYIQINDFVGDVKTFLDYHINEAQYSDCVLEYWGGYTSMMGRLMEYNQIECLDFRVPDYPDWSRIKKYINDEFTSYI